MSDLRPKGVNLSLWHGREEQTHELLFSINAIDSLQDMYKTPVFAVLKSLFSEKTGFDLKKIRSILCILLTDEEEKERFYDNARPKKAYTEKECGWLITVDNLTEVYFAILGAYRISVPDPEEGEEDEDEESP